MKIPALRLLLGLLAAAPLPAAFEAVRVDVTVEPQIPARLRMDGLREGRVVFAVDVDSEGKLNDWLVTAASHKELIGPCGEALQEWRFSPARYNGARVPARTIFTLNISQNSAVISRSVADNIGELIERVGGRPLDYQICPAAEVDQPLVATHRVRPPYSRDAHKLGVGGRVRVHFFVDERGEVRLPAVPVETHPYLSAIAVEAMRGWKFEPPLRRGRPVLVAAVQEFDFSGGGR